MSCLPVPIAAPNNLPPTGLVVEGSDQKNNLAGELSGGHYELYFSPVRIQKQISDLLCKHPDGLSQHQIHLTIGHRWKTLRWVLRRYIGSRWVIEKNPVHKGFVYKPRFAGGHDVRR